MFKEYIESIKPLIEKEMEVFLPKKATDQWIESYWYVDNVNFDRETFQKSLVDPFYNMWESGGKRLRPVLTCLIHEMYGGKNEEIYKLAILSEIIHTGTLMVDDVEDSSLLRRGRPCVYRVFGEGVAINGGCWLYYLSYRLIEKSSLAIEQKMKIYEMINTEMAKLHVGQGWDIWWGKEKNYQFLSKENYLQMTEYKTGALISIAMQMGGVLAGVDNNTVKKLSELAVLAGKAYQIKDDILDLLEGEIEWGKKMGQDITEGKLTYLVVETLSKANEVDRNRLMSILVSQAEADSLIGETKGIMQKYAIFETAEEQARDFLKEAKKIVETLDGESKCKEILLEFLDYLVERKK